MELIAALQSGGGNQGDYVSTDRHVVLPGLGGRPQHEQHGEVLQPATDVWFDDIIVHSAAVTCAD